MLVVVVVLLVQVIDVGVNKVMVELFKIVDILQKMLDFGLEGLIDYIKIIGLFWQKVKNVMKMFQILVDDYGGEVLCSCVVLESLLGVGWKIVNVVLNMWWKYLVQVVDIYIFCVGNCSGICFGKDVVVVECVIEDYIFVDY